jgi:hypothetical protein
MGIDTRKLHGLTEIVSPVCAEEAASTGNARLHRDTITFFQIVHVFADLEDNPSCFVA